MGAFREIVSCRASASGNFSQRCELPSMSVKRKVMVPVGGGGVGSKVRETRGASKGKAKERWLRNHRSLGYGACWMAVTPSSFHSVIGCTAPPGQTISSASIFSPAPRPIVMGSSDADK